MSLYINGPLKFQELSNCVKSDSIHVSISGVKLHGDVQIGSLVVGCGSC